MDNHNPLEVKPDTCNGTYSDRAIAMSQAISLKRIADNLGDLVQKDYGEAIERGIFNGAVSGAEIVKRAF